MFVKDPRQQGSLDSTLVKCFMETKGSSVVELWNHKSVLKRFFSKPKELLNYYFDLFSGFNMGLLRQEAGA